MKYPHIFFITFLLIAAMFTAPVAAAQICGHKFEDMNGNKIQDLGERSLVGWEMFIKGRHTKDTVFTDSSGNYCFENLDAGTYRVHESLENGWIQTIPGVKPYYYEVTLGDSDITNLDFANQLDARGGCLEIRVPDYFYGGTIYLNGAIVLDRTAPAQFCDLPFGPMTVVVEFPGYYPGTGTVTIDNQIPVAPRLDGFQPITTITVTSNIDGAAITLDGVDTGQVTPYTFDMPNNYGEHTISVSLSGYTTYTRVITTDPSDKDVVNALFASPSEVLTKVSLIDSSGSGISGADAYYINSDTNGWVSMGKTDAEGIVEYIIPMRNFQSYYHFELNYNTEWQWKIQNVEADPNVIFQMVPITAEMRDNSNPVQGATIYYIGHNGWNPLGVTGADGKTPPKDVLLNSYVFGADYQTQTTWVQQDMNANQNVVFETEPVTVSVIDSSGNPISGAYIEFIGVSGWNPFGTTGTDGTVTQNVLKWTYGFTASKDGDYAAQQTQNVIEDPTVQFQTGKVISESGTCDYYFASGWKTFTNGMEIMPGTHYFLFNDETPQSEYAITSGITNYIH
jgi:hypothetical protein